MHLSGLQIQQQLRSNLMAYYIKGTDSTYGVMYYKGDHQWSANLSDKKTFGTESAATTEQESIGLKDTSTVSIESE